MSPKQISLIQSYLDNAEVRINKSGYITLTNKKNPVLFSLLRQAGFFLFHTTNKGRIIGLHQAVYFIHYGWKALANKFIMEVGSHEIHHLDGNTLNNHPDNLVALSKQDHFIVSQASKTAFFGNFDSPQPTLFNREGKRIKDHKHYLVNVVQATVKNLTGLAPQFNAVLLNLPSELHKVVCTRCNSLNRRIRKARSQAKSFITKVEQKNPFLTKTRPALITQ